MCLTTAQEQTYNVLNKNQIIFYKYNENLVKPSYSESWYFISPNAPLERYETGLERGVYTLSFVHAVQHSILGITEAHGSDPKTC